MQQPGHDRLLVQLQIRKNNRHAKRMDDIWLTGFALLALMGLIGYPVSLFYHRNIIGRMVFPDTCNQLLIQLIRTRKILHLLDACVRLSDLFDFFLICLCIHRHLSRLLP